MQKTILFPIFAIVVAVLIPVAAKNNPVVMNIGGTDVRLSEFEYLYSKNKAQQEKPVTLDEYVGMFVDYKLKVLAAKAAGLDTTSAFRNDIDKFAHDLAKPYLVDSAVVDSLRAVTFERMHRNVDMSYILIGSDRGTPEMRQHLADSLAGVLNGGADFGDIARRYSSDRMAQRNGGHVGFITVGRYPLEIEEAIFTTTPGKISAPFETRFGTIIVKNSGERRDVGKVKVRHILKLYRGNTASDTLMVKHEIDSIYNVLKGGADFATVASATTDDPSGKKNGGALPWFGSGAMIPDFERVAYALADGQMSEPVATSYGFHIVLKEGHKMVGSLVAETEAIDEMIARDARGGMGRAAKMRQLSAESGITDAQELDAYAIKKLRESNSEFSNLLNEYYDGILLYEISDAEVWGKANSDVAGLDAYFKTHRSDFSWDKPRFKGYLLMATSDSVATAAREFVAANNTVASDSLQLMLRRKFGNDVRFERVLAPQGSSPVIDYVGFGGPRPEPMGVWKAFVPCRSRIVAQPEDYTDVKGLVSVEYQHELEKKWLDRLHRTYKVKINDKALNQIR